MTDPEYPECEKMKAVNDKSQSIGEFLEWLASEKRVYLATYLETEEVDADKLCLWHQSKESLLAEFFKIDLKKVEDERRAMLEKIRELQ